MMRYLPHTAQDIESMLQVTGHKSLDNLFDCIPKTLKAADGIKIPDSLSEWDLNSHMEKLAKGNLAAGPYKCYIGAGSYDHYIPAIIPYLISRSEFMTAYTPYQPEISQGTLQGIYEFQTMITQLLGMDIATASHYDGGTALTESALICLRNHKTAGTIAVSRLTHPHHRQIMKTYLRPTRFKIYEIPYDQSGRTDLKILEQMDDIAGICIQSPNFFGNIEDLEQIRQIATAKDAMMVISFTEALSYGLLKNPGSFGPDLVAGEGQSLGISKSSGGPGLGLLAGTNRQMRNLPGRLVGKTLDSKGRRGYVLTLSTREQHIRREKASSNICSNNGLCAMTAGIYLATLGKIGIQNIAQQNHDKAAYLQKALTESGFDPVFETPFFNEFVMKAPDHFKKKRQSLIKEHQILAGLDLQTFYPEMKNHYLFCATETASKADMDYLAKEVKK